MEIQEVSSKSLTIIEEASLINITDTDTYTQAGGLWANIRGLMKDVESTFSPIIAKAHASHKEALKQKGKIFDPLKQAGKSVKAAMEKWDFDQEQIRQAEEDRLRAIAQKEEEERQLAEALEAEQNGEIEAAEDILEAPVYTPPVVLPKATPKLQGGPVYRTAYKFRIIDERKIPREFMSPDMVKIGQVARAMKGSTNIPGVEVYKVRV